MSETFLYLTTIGRVTGNPHRIEIWYVTHSDCHYLCAEHRENADWVKNIRQNDTVSFYIAQRGQAATALTGTATIVTDTAIIDTISRKFDARYNWSEGLFVRTCPL